MIYESQADALAKKSPKIEEELIEPDLSEDDDMAYFSKLAQED